MRISLHPANKLLNRYHKLEAGCLLIVSVIGNRREPVPPAKITPFIVRSL